MTVQSKGLTIRIFKTKNFVRWAKKENVSDSALINAVNEVCEGLFDADLGGCLLKKRVARSGQGKRGGYRVLLAFKDRDRLIFMFGFSKNDRDNLEVDEKVLYKKLAKLYLGTTIRSLEKMCIDNQLFEVYHEQK